MRILTQVKNSKRLTAVLSVTLFVVSQLVASSCVEGLGHSPSSRAEDSSANADAGKIPDAVLAVLVQLILGIALATSAVPPTVLSVQDRGSETVGVMVVLILTGVSAQPLRARFGRGDLSESEYILIVLTPLITRLDLGLLIWVNVNKALVWAEQMLYATKGEVHCVQLLFMASQIWHDGESTVAIPDFGFYGGEASVLMYRLEKAYNPKNAGGNPLALLGHFTLWPVSWMFHALLQCVSFVGYTLLWIVAFIAHHSSLFGRGSRKKLTLRAGFLDTVFHSRKAHSAKLLMRPEVAAVLDTNQHLISNRVGSVRQIWGMVGTVDAVAGNSRFTRLFDVSYPMRAPLVLQRALSDPIISDVIALYNHDPLPFSYRPANPTAGIGEEGSRHVLFYRVAAWPSHTSYADLCMQRLSTFVEDNLKEWRMLKARLSAQDQTGSAADVVKKQSAEFTAVQQIMRRFLVQLVMLGWFDGLGECFQSNCQDIISDLTENYLRGHHPGIEMAVRLMSSDPAPQWYDVSDRNENSMLGSIGRKLPDCSCVICDEMRLQRRLHSSRYHGTPTAREVTGQLTDASCKCGNDIAEIWISAVRKWITLLFAPETVPATPEPSRNVIV